VGSLWLTRCSRRPAGTVRVDVRVEGSAAPSSPFADAALVEPRLGRAGPARSGDHAPGDGVEVDRLEDRVGLRTIRLTLEDPEGGHRVRVRAHGVRSSPAAPRGLPASMLVGSVTPERHRELVELARDGG